MKKIIWHFCFLLATLLAASCLDEITIAAPDRPEDGLVIQGKLVLGSPSWASIKVEQLYQYTSNIAVPVNDASVRLISNSGATFTFPGIPLDGIYTGFLSQAAFPVKVGEQYRVEITLADGQTIVSDWEKIAPPAFATSLAWQQDEQEIVTSTGIVTQVPAVAFSVNSPLRLPNGDKARLRWEFEDAYRITDDLTLTCYIENPYQNTHLYLLNGQTVSQEVLINYPLFKALRDQRFIDGYYLTAYQQSLTASAFQYWEEVASLREREGTIFDNPAGTISNNFTNLSDTVQVVYGYFSAFSQDTIRLHISREDMGNLPYYCPRPPTSLGPPPISVCDACIDALGASYIKPDYWQ